MNWKISLWLVAVVTAVCVESSTKGNNETVANTLTTPRLLRSGMVPDIISFSNNDESNDVSDLGPHNNVAGAKSTEEGGSNINVVDPAKPNTPEDKDATTETTIIITTEAKPTTTECHNECLTEATIKPTTETSAPDGDSTAAYDLVKETDNGPVKGIVWPVSKNILAYLDIPYGKFNRFEAPTKPEAWTAVLEVAEHNTRCPQLDGDSYVGDTDCLTLSVFTPTDPVNASVLFYIHEGGFTTGSGDPTIYGPEYLVPNNIILVLPNYRLGPLGFLCLKTNQIPGNAGLKDLTLALEWTKNNIATFGGDPMNIAVSGDGSSAALAGYLALSSHSRKFISKIITDSGSVLSHWAIDRDPVSTVEKVEKVVRNSTEEELGDDLFASIHLEKLLKSAKDVQIRPCVEKEGFLTETAWSILESAEFDITFMIGSANHAGLIEALQHNEASVNDMKDNFASVLPNDLAFDSTSDRNNVAQRLMRQYFSDGNITLDHSELISLFHTDASYLGPSARTARALAESGATVFLYEFSYVGRFNKELETIEVAKRFGAVRGDITGYLFTQDGRLVADGVEEKQMVDMLVTLWTSFLETGIPSANELEWKPIDASNDTEVWLAINAEPSLQSKLHGDRLQLWAEVYRSHFVDRSAAPAAKALAFLSLVCSLVFLMT